MAVRRFLAEGKEIKAYDEKYGSYALRWLQNLVKTECGAGAEKAEQLLFDVEYWESQLYKSDKGFAKRILELTRGFQSGEDSTSAWRCPNMGSYTKEYEYRYAFLVGVANGSVDVDWFACGLPVVRNMEHDPRKVDKPEPIIDEMLTEALIWAKVGAEPASGLMGLFCCMAPLPSRTDLTLEQYDGIMDGIFNVKYAIRSGFRAGKHYDKDYELQSPCKGVGRVLGSSPLDLYCRAVTSSMDGYGDVIAEASETRRKAAADFDARYCKGTDGIWRSKEAEAERLARR